MDVPRYLEAAIMKDLTKKMVFLGGPRQCGKTTLAEHVVAQFPYRKNNSGIYFNWDDDIQRRKILKRHWEDKNELIVFDELHKYHRWKNWLKGLYDSTKKRHKYLVTGSARLDVYKKGGDSLFGRYHYWRLHPMSLSEPIKGISQKNSLKRLMTLGGFPEPFLDGSETEAVRWRRERFDRVLREDVRDLNQLHNIHALPLFVDCLRERVGSLVVLSNIAEDIQISQKTLKRWLDILETMYILFAVRPLVKNIPRAIQKPPKVYFFDNGDVIGDEGSRFENLVATHLLKKIHFLEDSTGHRYELRYIRDKEGREVDFVILKNGKCTDLVEVKLSDKKIHKPLNYYATPKDSNLTMHTRSCIT